MQSKKSQLFKVTPKDRGERLQNFLKKHLEETVSGKAIKKLIDSYGCSINGKKQLFSSYKVQAGDLIEVSLSHLESNVDSSVVVLHETSNYLICSKGINTPSDEILFRKLLKREDLFLVHRLDKDTTGLIVVAKNNSSKIYFEELFKKREIKKIYHAISEGNAKEADFKVENYVGKIASYQGQSIWGRVSKESGLFASTYFRVLKKVNKTALLECQPTTGRTHQIRVHLSESSLPIVGDYHYAKELRFFYASKRPLLHAYSISFKDQQTNEIVEYKAPYPEDFSKALEFIFNEK
jgi:RluA family pseudouridine synthase